MRIKDGSDILSVISAAADISIRPAGLFPMLVGIILTIASVSSVMFDGNE
jgi:hypothetical protein